MQQKNSRPTATEPIAYRLGEACRMIGIKPRTWRKWRAEGKAPADEVALSKSLTLVDGDQLRAWWQAQKAASQREAA